MPPRSRDPWAEFVTARLAEDEAAIAAVYGYWRDDGTGNIADTSYAALVAVGPRGRPVDEASRAFILRYGPERAHRQLAATRALLAAYEASVRSFGPGLSVSLLRLVQAAAEVWSGHPDHAALTA